MRITLFLHCLLVFTCKVGKRVKTKEADYLLDSISRLKQVVPEIWRGLEMERGGDHGATAMRSDLDSIRPTSPVGA